MNDRHVAGAGLLKYLLVLETYLIGKWSRAMTAVLIVTLMGVIMIPSGVTLAEDQASVTDSSEGTGIQVGSWLLTVPYCMGKSAFAIAGGTVGVLGHLFSGGNSATAQSVWTGSIYGTYILRPAHLRGEEPIRFFGKADGNQSEPVKRAAVAPNQATK